MAHPLTSLRRRLLWSPACHVVLLGVAVAAAGLLPGLGAVLGVLAAAWAWGCGGRRSWGNEHPVVEFGRPHTAVLAAGVVLLALTNAAGEEWYWRGSAMHVLQDEGVGPRTTIVAQAASFGLAHAAGLPGGPVGVVGAFVLGLVLGVLRWRSAGMPGCVAVHALVDVAIFGLVAHRVVWVG